MAATERKINSIPAETSTTGTHGGRRDRRWGKGDFRAHDTTRGHSISKIKHQF